MKIFGVLFAVSLLSIILNLNSIKAETELTAFPSDYSMSYDFPQSQRHQFDDIFHTRNKFKRFLPVKEFMTNVVNLVADVIGIKRRALKNLGESVRAFAKFFVDAIRQRPGSGEDEQDSSINEHLLQIRGLVQGLVTSLDQIIQYGDSSEGISQILERVRNEGQRVLNEASSLQNHLTELRQKSVQERELGDKRVKDLANTLANIISQKFENSSSEVRDSLNSSVNQAQEALDNNLKICNEQAQDSLNDLEMKVNDTMKSFEPSINQLIDRTQRCLTSSQNSWEGRLCWRRFKEQFDGLQDVHSEILRLDRRAEVLLRLRNKQWQCQTDALNNFKAESANIKQNFDVALYNVEDGNKM